MKQLIFSAIHRRLNTLNLKRPNKVTDWLFHNWQRFAPSCPCERPQPSAVSPDSIPIDTFKAKQISHLEQQIKFYKNCDPQNQSVKIALLIADYKKQIEELSQTKRSTCDQKHHG